jgi:hypothetical protein
VLKECELRVNDATDFATGYVTGKLSAKQAEKRLSQYDDRWGSPLRGIYASSYSTDDAIVKDIDATARERRAFLERYSKDASREGSS